MVFNRFRGFTKLHFKPIASGVIGASLVFAALTPTVLADRIGGPNASKAPMTKEAPAPVLAAKPVLAAPTDYAGVKGKIERTFIAVKPDGTQRGLVGTIISRFEQKGYKLVAIKSTVPSVALAEEHYGDLKSKPFYPGLVSYMTSGAAPVIAMVWEGPNVISTGRKIIGATNPLDAEPGSIRGDYCISVGRNVIHGSDAFETANKEIPLWFKDEELNNWAYANEEWIISAN